MPQLETDVVVIGGGTSGLVAAVAAAEKGARVVVFEKAATTGGTGNMGMGIFAVDSRVHRENNVQLTTDEAFNIFMNETHWRGDARLIRAFIDKSASTIDWLEDMGVQFTYMEPEFEGHYGTGLLIVAEDSHTGAQASGTMIKRLTERAQKLGVTFLLRTQAKKVLKEGGRITGVIAEDESGETVQAKAKAVIIATGGFGDNPEWIKKYTGYEWGRDFYSLRIPGLVGEGIRMAWEAGAGASEMSMQLIFGMPGTALQWVAVGALFRQPNLMVNLLGERFFNEEIMAANTAFTGNALSRQKNRCAFNIFDEATKKYYAENGLDFVSPVFPNITMESIDAELKQALDEGNENVFVVDSLEELATKTGINADGLRETADEYNATCEAGRDGLFNKKPKYLRPIKQPKFYAGRFFPSAYGSLGGIRINYKLEVLNKDYEVIPGFYAVGTDVNTLYGDSYIFALAGNTMGFAVNSGRMAGENAIEYIKSIAKSTTI
jgi:fumarate reductase flavoprotein subunit